MKHYFRYSVSVRVVTAVVVALVSLLTIVILLGSMGVVARIACLMVCWLPLLLAAAFAPVCYEDKGGEVTLRLLGMTLHYPMATYDVSHCSLPLQNSLRLFGSGGFLGALGWFYHHDIGRFLLFKTGSGDRYLRLVSRRTGRVTLIEE